MDESTTLRACPFCGSEAELLWREEIANIHLGTKWTVPYIECKRCGCCTRSFLPCDEERAIDAWNARGEQVRYIPVPDGPEIPREDGTFWF